MTTQHTPGPWLLDREPAFADVAGKGTGRLAISIHAEGQNGRPLIRVGARSDDEAEVRANAALVAAAPDMLAALIELVETARPNIYPQPDKPNSAWGRLQRADAAIAKARGAQ